jgi:hypothetical protein
MAATSGSTLGENSRFLPFFVSVSIGGILLFIAVFLLLHLLSPEFNPATRFISEYALGTYGYLLTLGFVALGLGSIFLVMVLLQVESTHGIAWKTGLLLLSLWGLGVIADGFFPIDQGVEPVTMSGEIHLMAAMIAFLSLMISSLLLSLQFLKKPSFQKIARPSLIIVALIFILFIWGNIADAAIQGLTQRLFVCACISWLLFVSLYVRLTIAANLRSKL